MRTVGGVAASIAGSFAAEQRDICRGGPMSGVGASPGHSLRRGMITESAKAGGIGARDRQADPSQ